MHKLVVGVVLTLAGSLIAVGPAGASTERRVTVKSISVQHVGSAVVVKGRVTGPAKKVRVERKSGGRWVVVRRVAVRKGSYAATTTPVVGTSSYRVGTAKTYSATRTLTVVRTASRPKPTPSTDACGTRPAKADGTLWSCSFVDDFSGTTLDRTKWHPQTRFRTGEPGNDGAAQSCTLDDPSTVNVANGALNLVVRKLDAPVTCDDSDTPMAQYGSGTVSTYRLFSQQYGRWEARIKNSATTAAGLQESFWLWPDDRAPATTSPAYWPYAGEIDISETYSQYPGLSVPFLHYAQDVHGPQPGTNTAWNCAADRGVWNTYRLEWSADRLEIFVNDKSCLVNTSGDPAFAKPYIAAFTAALGVDGNAHTGKAPIPATMSVDYLRVWK